MIVLLFACAAPESTTGVLWDALHDAPVVGAAVRAEAEGCVRVSSLSDDAGHFEIDTPCAGGTLAPVDAAWWSPTATPVAPEVRLEVWPAPETDGAFLLRDGVLEQLTTNTPLGGFTTARGEVRYPLVLPGEPPRADHDDHVLLAGEVAGSLPLWPLLPTPALTGEGPGGAVRFDAWVAVGQDVSIDGDVTPRDPAPAGAEVTGTTPGRPATVRYLPTGPLASGRWLLGEREASRGVVIEVVDG